MSRKVFVQTGFNISKKKQNIKSFFRASPLHWLTVWREAVITVTVCELGMKLDPGPLLERTTAVGATLTNSDLISRDGGLGRGKVCSAGVWREADEHH